MTKKQFLQIKGRLEKLLEKAENDALTAGVDITSQEFQNILYKIKEEVLRRKGLTIKEYDDLEEDIAIAEEDDSQEDGQDVQMLASAKILLNGVKKTINDIDDKLKEIDKFRKTVDDLTEMIEYVANKQLDEDDVKKLIPAIKYYDSDIARLRDKIDAIKIPKMPKIQEIPEMIDYIDDINEIKDNLKKETEERKKAFEDRKKDMRGFSESLLNKAKVMDKKAQEAVIEPLRRLGMGLESQINSITVETISLDSQCNSVLKTFSLGKKVRALIVANLNGGIGAATLDSGKTSITTTIAPDSGEELRAVVLI